MLFKLKKYIVEDVRYASKWYNKVEGFIYINTDRIIQIEISETQYTADNKSLYKIVLSDNCFAYIDQEDLNRLVKEVQE